MLTSGYPSQLHQAAQSHPLTLVFASLGGAHLYGCPSVDSDWEVRGAHVLGLREVLGLSEAREHMRLSHLPNRAGSPEDFRLDLLTQDIRRLALSLLERTPLALEQVLSPLVVQSSSAHAQLCDLARQCVTASHADFYLSLASNQWRLAQQGEEAGERARLKYLLYAFRALLSGIYLMQTGEIESNLQVLNASARLPYLDDLLAMKRGGLEQDLLSGPLEPYASELQRLSEQLREDRRRCQLPLEAPPSARAALSEWVIHVRLGAEERR